MKIRIYPKLAWSGISKNRKLYVPYILTCICTIMMYVIIMTLINDGNIPGMQGGAALRSILMMGSWVLAAFSALFLFYTNSSIMKKRRKELGLYNVLGMSKSNIAVVLLIENVIVAAVSLAGGIALGTVLARLSEAGLAYILNENAGYGMLVSYEAVILGTAVFGVIFLLIFLNSVRQVRFSNAVSLIKSENTGERPPKGNFLICLGGIILLAGAYYISVTIKNPLTALGYFFVAVLMVIVGTYAMFISGSVMICRILKHSKRYYYRAQHFISVSQMSYRMKRNGAGLASICIICTMVLVMISSSACLYIATEKTVEMRYPEPVSVSVAMRAGDVFSEKTETIKKYVYDMLAKEGVSASSEVEYRSFYMCGDIKDGVITEDGMNVNIFILPLEDYNKILAHVSGNKKSESLGADEALIYAEGTDYAGDSITAAGVTYKTRRTDINPIRDDRVVTGLATFVIILNDPSVCLEHYGYGKWYFGFSTDADGERETELSYDLISGLQDTVTEENGFGGVRYVDSDSRARGIKDYYTITGGLLFIGIILSTVFIFAGVLIIYYKQVSEGYEDKSRFDIMRNVGMTDREIRKSINSQILTVFILPPAAAVVHLMFAFPIIKKLLSLFAFGNTLLLAGTIAVCVAVFVILYAAVYKITSNAYYAVVKK